MNTFAETANVDYRISFADQGKQTSVFCYYTVQVGRPNTGNRRTVDRQTSYRMEDIIPVSSMYVHYMYMYSIWIGTGIL